MMTRRDVLDQLKRVGIQELSQLKKDCREFENYMSIYYDYKILRKESEAKPLAPSPEKPSLSRLKISLNLKRYLRDSSGLSFSPSRVKSGDNRGQ